MKNIKYIVPFILLLIVSFVYVKDAKCSLPSKKYRKTPSELKIQYDSLNILTTDGKRLTAWLCKPEKKRTDVVMILASGDAGNMGDNLVLTQFILENVGVNILLFDYRGFGSSDLNPTDTDLIAIPEFTIDIHSVVLYVRKYIQSDTNKIVLYGRSMGASLCLTTAITYGSVGGVIAESPYVTQASLVEKINVFRKQQNSKRIAKSLPSPLLEPLSLISQCHCNVLFIHGQNEKFISNNEVMDLYNSCSAKKKTLWIASDCDHLEVVYKEKDAFFAHLSSILGSLY